MLIDKKRIAFDAPDQTAYLRQSLDRSGFKEIPLTSDIAFLSGSMRFEHGDPADRFIAATAKHLNLPLLTFDGYLRNLPWLKTVEISLS